MKNTVAPFTLSVAKGIRGNAQNKEYTQTVQVTSLQELLAATQFDHVAGTFTNGERGTENFINADCLMMDCDNTHSDNPKDWLTPKQLAERLQNVPFYVVFSKSHMKEKAGKAPAPRYHVYFPLSKYYEQPSQIRDMKEALLRLVPEFDDGAKDAARFFYGVSNPKAETFTGDILLDDFLTAHADDLFTARSATKDLAKTNSGKQKGKQAKSGRGEILSETPSILDQMIASHPDSKGYFDFIGNPNKVIPEGNRHNVLLQIAVGAISNEQPLDIARQTYEKACRQCIPPHDKKDIARIWNDAKAYVEKLEASDDEQKGRARKGRKKGKQLSTADIEAVLIGHKITLRYNVITKTVEVLNMPLKGQTIPKAYATLSEYDRRNINVELLPLCLTPMLKNAGYTFGAQFLKDSITAIAKLNSYNPVLEMLKATKWDGYDRIDKLERVLGIIPDDDDNDTFSTAELFYCKAVEKWLHQAIALALNEKGTRAQEFVLTLQGAQGIGKTNLFRALAVYPEWFRGGTVINMTDKDSKIESVKQWICELGELDSTLKKEQSSLKGHISEHWDDIRMPYGSTWDRAPRRTCYCATVNPEQVHRDDTGSRRFVYLHIERIDKDYLYSTMFQQAWAMQLWRQVYEQLYLPNPEGYHLTPDELAFNEKSNEPFRVPLKAETELRDNIDFEECYKSEPEGFSWYTASDIKERLNLRMYSANQIGEALKYLCTVHPHCEHRRVRGKTQYLLPPVPDINDD